MCMGNHKLNTILLSLLVSASFSLRVYSEEFFCNTDDVNKFLEEGQVSFIEIETNKTRKWTKNYLRAVSDFKNGDISEKYKKKFNADIKVRFDNGLECTYPSKIRISGDRIDHLGWGGGIKNISPPITSLDVRLLEKNINSIVKFKLFIPQTKNGENEIISTILLTELGFLAPLTSQISAVFNGIKTEFLFQEKITKEFLESNYLREAPILEGDERFLFLNDIDSFDRFGLARLLNGNWAEKGSTSLDISERALKILNQTYLEYLSGKHIQKNLHDRLLSNPNSGLKEKKFNKDKGFAALVLAMGAAHGLRPHNRSFYYDPIYNYFRPIYYDGNSSITALSPESNLKEFVRYGKNLSKDEIDGASIAIKSIKNLNRLNFLQKVQDRGLIYNLEETNKILDRITSNLETIKNTPIINFQQTDSLPYFSNYKKSNQEISSKKLVFSSEKEEILEVCDFSLDNCSYKRFSAMNFSKLLEGRYSDKTDLSYIFIGSKTDYLSGRNTLSNQERKVFDLGNGADLVVYGVSSVKINKEEKLLQLLQRDTKDRFLIQGGKLENWKIEFVGLLEGEKDTSQAFNKNLLTGCLTILDLEAINLNIKVDGAVCEDGLNFVRVSGTIDSINIRNTSRDAFDADFSELVINEIQIINAGNDCVDLSSGDYNIGYAELSTCSDKAISVGEKSQLILGTTKISKSNIGLASKDSSFISVDNVKAISIETCFSAYNKKQEFWGGKISIKEHNCNPDQIISEKTSLIEIVL